MTSASRTLAQFALELCFEDIPPDVIERACIIDTIGAARYGSRLAWSRIILDYAQRTSAPGEAIVIGTGSR